MGKRGPPMLGAPPVNPFANIPIIGPWSSRMGKVKNIFATPCSPSPAVWLEAAAMASPRLAYLFAKPFLIADQWHARTGRGHRKAKGIVRLLQEGTKKSWVTTTKFFIPFQITADFILKAEWYLMIIDRATEFAVNSSSLAYLYSGCNTPATRWVNVERNDGYIYLSSHPQLIGPMYGTEWPGTPIVTGVVGIPAKFTGVVTMGFSATSIKLPPFPTPHNWHVELVNIVDGASSAGMGFRAGENETVGGADASAHDGLNATTQLYGMFISGDEGFIRIEHAELGMHAFKTGEKGLSFDP